MVRHYIAYGCNSIFSESATNEIHKISIETAVLPDHLQKMSEDILTADGLLNAPGQSNAIQRMKKTWKPHTTPPLKMIYSASLRITNKSLCTKCLAEHAHNPYNIGRESK